MEHEFFVTITIKVGYNCIKTLEYITKQNLIAKINCVHSNPVNDLIVIDFNTNSTTEETIANLKEILKNKIELLTYKQTN